jgi:hypothetical protein
VFRVDKALGRALENRSAVRKRGADLFFVVLESTLSLRRVELARS